MNFSLLLNSRGRVNLLSEFLSSVKETTENPSLIEILVVADHDDKNTVQFLQGEKGVKSFFFPRSFNMSKNFNSLAHQAAGKYLFLLNDDVKFLTPRWDVLALSRLNSGIIYGKTICDSADRIKSHGDYSSFPILGLEGVLKLGFVLYPQFPGLGADSVCYRLYSAANRVVDTGVRLSHVSHTSMEKVNSPDAVAAEMRSWKYPDPMGFDITKDVARLVGKFPN